MEEQMILSDLLATQNLLAQHCGLLAQGCTTAGLRDLVWGMLDEQYLIQGELTDEMVKRKWLCPAAASQDMTARVLRYLEKNTN